MTETQWMIFGFCFQACFFARFFVQWIASEKAKRSVIPTSFWYFSIVGAAGLLAYAIHREDPVFGLGQGVGFFIYFRNLMLIQKAKNAEALAEDKAKAELAPNDVPS